MLCRLLNLAAATSTTLLLGTLALWIFSYQIKPSPAGIYSHITPDGLLLYDDVRILAFRGKLSLYNQGVQYSGSIISINPRWPKTRAYDLAGIYFRHFAWPGHFPGGSYWTLTIPLLHFAVPFSLIPLTWISL